MATEDDVKKENATGAPRAADASRPGAAQRTVYIPPVSIPLTRQEMETGITVRRNRGGEVVVYTHKNGQTNSYETNVRVDEAGKFSIGGKQVSTQAALAAVNNFVPQPSVIPAVGIAFTPEELKGAGAIRRATDGTGTIIGTTFKNGKVESTFDTGVLLDSQNKFFADGKLATPEQAMQAINNSIPPTFQRAGAKFTAEEIKNGSTLRVNEKGSLLGYILDKDGITTGTFDTKVSIDNMNRFSVDGKRVNTQAALNHINTLDMSKIVLTTDNNWEGTGYPAPKEGTLDEVKKSAGFQKAAQVLERHNGVAYGILGRYSAEDAAVNIARNDRMFITQAVGWVVEKFETIPDDVKLARAYVNQSYDLTSMTAAGFAHRATGMAIETLTGAKLLRGAVLLAQAPKIITLANGTAGGIMGITSATTTAAGATVAAGAGVAAGELAANTAAAGGVEAVKAAGLRGAWQATSAFALKQFPTITSAAGMTGTIAKESIKATGRMALESAPTTVIETAIQQNMDNQGIVVNGRRFREQRDFSFVRLAGDSTVNAVLGSAMFGVPKGVFRGVTSDYGKVFGRQVASYALDAFHLPGRAMDAFAQAADSRPITLFGPHPALAIAGVSDDLGNVTASRRPFRSWFAQTETSLDDVLVPRPVAGSVPDGIDLPLHAAPSSGSASHGLDADYKRAIEAAVEMSNGNPTVGTLASKLGIGMNEARPLVARMEADGILVSVREGIRGVDVNAAKKALADSQIDHVADAYTARVSTAAASHLDTIGTHGRYDDAIQLVVHRRGEQLDGTFFEQQLSIADEDLTLLVRELENNGVVSRNTNGFRVNTFSEAVAIREAKVAASGAAPIISVPLTSASAPVAPVAPVPFPFTGLNGSHPQFNNAVVHLLTKENETLKVTELQNALGIRGRKEFGALITDLEANGIVTKTRKGIHVNSHADVPQIKFRRDVETEARSLARMFGNESDDAIRAQIGHAEARLNAFKQHGITADAITAKANGSTKQIDQVRALQELTAVAQARAASLPVTPTAGAAAAASTAMPTAASAPIPTAAAATASTPAGTTAAGTTAAGSTAGAGGGAGGPGGGGTGGGSGPTPPGGTTPPGGGSSWYKPWSWGSRATTVQQPFGLPPLVLGPGRRSAEDWGGSQGTTIGQDIRGIFGTTFGYYYQKKSGDVGYWPNPMRGNIWRAIYNPHAVDLNPHARLAAKAVREFYPTYLKAAQTIPFWSPRIKRRYTELENIDVDSFRYVYPVADRVDTIIEAKLKGFLKPGTGGVRTAFDEITDVKTLTAELREIGKRIAAGEDPSIHNTRINDILAQLPTHKNALQAHADALNADLMPLSQGTPATATTDAVPAVLDNIRTLSGVKPASNTLIGQRIETLREHINILGRQGTNPVAAIDTLQTELTRLNSVATKGSDFGKTIEQLANDLDSQLERARRRSVEFADGAQLRMFGNRLDTGKPAKPEDIRKLKRSIDEQLVFEEPRMLPNMAAKDKTDNNENYFIFITEHWKEAQDKEGNFLPVGQRQPAYTSVLAGHVARLYASGNEQDAIHAIRLLRYHQGLASEQIIPDDLGKAVLEKLQSDYFKPSGLDVSTDGHVQHFIKVLNQASLRDHAPDDGGPRDVQKWYVLQAKQWIWGRMYPSPPMSGNPDKISINPYGQEIAAPYRSYAITRPLLKWGQDWRGYLTGREVVPITQATTPKVWERWQRGEVSPAEKELKTTLQFSKWSIPKAIGAWTSLPLYPPYAVVKTVYNKVDLPVVGNPFRTALIAGTVATTIGVGGAAGLHFWGPRTDEWESRKNTLNRLGNSAAHYTAAGVDNTAGVPFRMYVNFTAGPASRIMAEEESSLFGLKSEQLTITPWVDAGLRKKDSFIGLEHSGTSDPVDTSETEDSAPVGGTIPEPKLNLEGITGVPAPSAPPATGAPTPPTGTPPAPVLPKTEPGKDNPYGKIVSNEPVKGLDGIDLTGAFSVTMENNAPTLMARAENTRQFKPVEVQFGENKNNALSPGAVPGDKGKELKDDKSYTPAV